MIVCVVPAVQLKAVFGAVTVIFLLMRVIPGDAAAAILGEQASPEALASLRQELGLQDPLPVQYLRFVAAVAHSNAAIYLAELLTNPIAPDR